MKLHDRLEALRMLWQMNDLTIYIADRTMRGEMLDHIIALRNLIERQKRQGAPRA